MTEEDKVVALPAEVASERRRPTDLMPQTAGKAVVVEVDREVPDFGAALLQLQSAISQMAPDDVSLDYHEDRSATRATRHLKLRAYRKVGG